MDNDELINELKNHVDAMREYTTAVNNLTSSILLLVDAIDNDEEPESKSYLDGSNIT